MSTHRHLSSEDILEQLDGPGLPAAIAGCATCGDEAATLSLLLAEVTRLDAERVATSGWDDLLVRRRIREALAQEKPHRLSIFDRFFVLRPVFVSAVVASIALMVWAPLSRVADPGTRTASIRQTTGARLPAWSPLPDEADDEGLAVLAEWTPNADEVSIASCHSACLSGLSDHEEEHLLNAVITTTARSPLTESSPL